MTFNIGSYQMVPGSMPLFLPDIGTFFNQDVSIAKDMIKKLSNAGVHVIKGEVLHSPDICLPESGDEEYYGHQSGVTVRENYRKLIERKVVSLSAYDELFQYCRNLGLDVVVSVYDREGVDFSKSINVSAIKIASSNITHQPLIEYIAATALPMIIDTGHAALEEISRAVDWAHDAGADKLILEHSPLGPPAPVEQHNLRFMSTLGSTFGLPYGLSDHHATEEMLYAATAMGACILEKGVCPDGMGDEQDGGHALPVSQVAEVLKKIKNISLAMGDGVRTLRRDREKYRSRMGLVAKRDLVPGDTVDIDTVTFAFPIRGIGTEYWTEVCGKPLEASIKQGDPITWDHV